MKKVVIAVGKSRITILESEYDPKIHTLYEPKKETETKKRK